MKVRKVFLESVDSTNAYAKEHGASFEKSTLTLISAEEQTGGYGQFQREWLSPKGVNLYATFYFHLPLTFREKVSELTLLLSITLKKVLEKNGFQPTLKWPNDVLLNGKKVAGVLCEVTFNPDSIEVILGFGLNVNMEKEDLLKIDQTATSLKNETNKPWDKQSLLEDILEAFVFDLKTFKTPSKL